MKIDIDGTLVKLYSLNNGECFCYSGETWIKAFGSLYLETQLGKDKKLYDSPKQCLATRLSDGGIQVLNSDVDVSPIKLKVVRA